MKVGVIGKNTHNTGTPIHQFHLFLSKLKWQFMPNAFIKVAGFLRDGDFLTGGTISTNVILIFQKSWICY